MDRMLDILVTVNKSKPDRPSTSSDRSGRRLSARDMEVQGEEEEEEDGHV